MLRQRSAVSDFTRRLERSLLPAVATLGLAASIAGCGAASAQSAPTQPRSTAAQFTVQTPDGRTRRYLVYSPGKSSKPRPLVMVFHGALDTAPNTVQETDFEQVADQRGEIVAFMEGYMNTWNEGAGHTPAEVAGIDDVAYTTTVLNQIERHYAIDRTRIAAAGFSNCALMTELLGCRLANRITLVVPVAGPLPVSVSPGCHPARPISVLEVHGTADQSIPYGGGPFPGVGGGTTVLSVPASAARWAALDGCAAKPQTTGAGTATVLTTYSRCHGGVAVQLRSIQGGTHSWGAGIGGIVASFLARHAAARPAAGP
jgi:polyhydroxybutyrate depolymerase